LENRILRSRRAVSLLKWLSQRRLSAHRCILAVTLGFMLGRPYRSMLLFLALAASTALRAEVLVSGKVVDETGAAIVGARVELLSSDGPPSAQASSDAAGNFTLSLPQAGEYRLRAQRQGFFLFEAPPRRITEDGQYVTVTLNHLQELTESVEVTSSPPVIDPDQPAERKELDNVEILTVPYPAPQDFRNALPLLGGVVQDNSGRLHVNGGASDQTAFTLDGFDIADPVTGRLEMRVNIDSVRSLDLDSTRIAPERGRGSAGSLDVKTKMGDDRLRFGGTNFIPGFSTEQGLHMNKWTPRLELSGPIAKGRAWFYDGFDTFYDLDTVQGLPRGENRSRGLSGSNISRAQVNITPAHIVTASFLVNYADNNREGLNFLNPSETTTNRLNTLYHGSLRHQAYMRGALVEAGYAESRGVVRQVPQGDQLFEITPFGSRGNYFVHLDRHYSRRQWTAAAFLPAFEAAGSHQLKVGIDLEQESFRQQVERHDYRVLRTDLSLARHVTFAGGPYQRRSNFEAAQYIQDHWTPRPGVALDAGLRTEWNEITRRVELAPRLSAAWAPRRFRDTKLSAGFGVFYDNITLGTITRHQDQVSFSTFFSPAGHLRQGPVMTAFQVDEHALRAPRYWSGSLGMERKLPFEFFGKASFLHRIGTRGFAFLNSASGENLPATGAALYSLWNSRRDRYTALELSARRAFGGRFEWVASYTRSRALSNSVVDFSLENPIFAPQMAGPVGWDTPNRFLTWGWAPLPKRLLPSWLRFLTRETDIVYLVEYRSGYPFGVVNEEGVLVGAANSRRFPSYFNVNLHFERRFKALHYLWAWRFGFYNLTNNGNPNVVNNNIDSPDYLVYGRGQQRAFSVRLRFLGRR
jgi:hypothetical protein